MTCPRQIVKQHSMNKNNFNLCEFDEAADILLAGGVCAFPTDTVFGLGARADDSSAVSQLFALKNRHQDQPIIALCADIEMAQSIVSFSPVALLLSALWPGALTLVLPASAHNKLAPEVSVGLKTQGVRVPDNKQIQKLICAIGVPLATTSANISGQKTALDASEIVLQLGKNMPVLKTIQPPSGQESTILSVQGSIATLIRAGAISATQIEQTTGVQVHSLTE